MNERHAAFTNFEGAYAGHFHGGLSTCAEAEEFVDGAADMAGPSGERSTAEVTTPEGEVALEFALFEDCGYLRRGDQVAVAPSFLDEDGDIRTDADLPEPRLIQNSMDEIETLTGDRLPCPLSWIRDVVLTFFFTGDFTEEVTWMPIEDADVTTGE